MAFAKNCHTLTPVAFGLAIQALAMLARSDHVCPSQQIAHNMRSGTSFMRRVMAPLVRAQLVEAREGRDGGYLLARSPQKITVADVYRALQMTDPLTTGLLESTSDCPNGQVTKAVFTEMTSRAERNVLDIYEQYTIADIVNAAHLSIV